VLYAFACMLVLYFTFGCFHYACLHFPPLSRLSARLRALVDPFVANWCATFTRAFICSSMCASPSRGLSFAVRNFILASSLSLGLCACALLCLVIDSLELCDRSVFYFVGLIGAPGRLDICFFWDTFVFVFKLLLSPLSFGGFFPSGTFYASAI
jgi:hypothetical protein